MKREHILKMVMLAMLVAIGVVISPILRVEGMCPMAHLINIVCSVFLGPWYSLLCATLIGIIRMTLMGIPPLALTGAVFGAFLSGVFYRLSGGKILCAVLGEVFGTGVIGALASYPVMTYIVGREGLTWAFYIPSFIGGTLILAAPLRSCSSWRCAATDCLQNSSMIWGRRSMTPLLQNALLKARNDLRETAPLIHCITNPIAINDCANGILAVGGKPIMAEHPDEVEEITCIAGALGVNIGNITDARRTSVLTSAKAAKTARCARSLLTRWA